MISLIIPTFNEEKRLERSLAKLRDFLKTFPDELEVIIADDGSSDSTVKIAESFKDKFAKLRILELTHRGKGAAIKAGFEQAVGSVVVFTDADFSTPIIELPKLLKEIDDGYDSGTEHSYDIAIGSRALDRSTVREHQPLLRETIGRLSNILIRIFAVPGIYDTQCGFKAFRRSACVKIFAEQTVTGFAFDIELLFLARRAGLKIKEVPVLWYNDPSSSVRPFADTFYSFLDLIKVRLRHSHTGESFGDKLFRPLHRHRTYVRFFMVGLTSTLIDYSVYITLTRVFNFDPLRANPFSVECAIIWSFTLNNLWTFSQRQTGKHIFQRFLAFQFVSLGGLMISQMQILVFIHAFSVHDLLAKVLTIPLTGIFNYIANSRWTFKELQQKSSSFSRIYPVLIVVLFVIYLILVKQLTGSFSILLPR